MHMSRTEMIIQDRMIMYIEKHRIAITPDCKSKQAAQDHNMFCMQDHL